MSQAIKTKKIEKRTKKIKPGTAKEIVGGGKHPARKDIEANLGKPRKELAVIKKTTDAASEFAENIIDTVREPLFDAAMNMRNPVLLCVDDEDANLKLLEKLLIPRGYVVVCAATGKDALLKIKSQAIDLVLLDIIMPGMDGFEVCRQIKEDPMLRSIPVIMVTSLSAKQDHIRGIEAGADEFLSKPIEKTRALARIKILLKVKELSDERNRAEEALQKAHDELDRKVRERTAELAQANEMLQADIAERKQIEEILRKSEENFRCSLEDSPLGVRIATATGETIYANKAFLDIYDYESIEEFNKIPLKERYTPQSYAEFQMRKKAREKGDFGPTEYEINIVRKNGEIRHLQVLRKEILWNGTKQFQVIYQDITERKRAEAALRKNTQLLMDTGEMAQVGGWELDLSTKEVLMTEEVSRIHGVEPGYRPKLEEALNFYAPESRPEVEAVLKKAAETGEPYTLESLLIPRGSKDKIWVRSLGKAVYNGSKITKLTGTFQNIDKYKRAQEALQVSEKKLNEAQVLGQIGNWEYDVKNQKITWSDQVYKLYERDPVLGPPTTEEEAAYYSPEQGQTLRGYTRNAIETGQFFEYDLQATLPSGKHVYLAARMRPIKDAQGHVIKLFGIVQDITGRKQAESQREAALEALRESESRIKSISNNFTAGMIYQVVINPDGNRKFTYLSDSVQQLYGISPEEGMADATLIYSRVHEDDLELLTKDEDEAVKTFSTFKTDARMKDPSGKIRWSSFLSTPKMMADGSICFDGIEFIITERKLAEEALIKSEEKFRKAFYTSPDSVAITRLEDGMYISINPGFTKITGYTEEDIFGKTSIGDNIWNNLEDRQRLVAGLKKHGEVTNLEAAFRMKDGNIRYGLMSASIIDLAGVPHFLSITRDITERKRVEEALRESEEKYRSVFNNFVDLYYQTDMQGLITNLSPSCFVLSGWKPEELIGCQVLDFYTDPKQRKAFIEKLFRDSAISDFEITLLHRDERHIPVSVSSHLIRNEQGDLKYVEGVIRDITERKQAEGKIINSLVEKEVLLKEVHHRVKNNLMIIIGLIKMQEAKVDNKMFTPLLQELEGRIRAMAQVHEGFYKSADLAHVDLQNYIETMGAQISTQFGTERNIRFSVQAVGLELGLDIAVPCGLILNELITNAYKHAFPGDKPRAGEDNCEIKVIVEQEGGVLILTVANNGVGLPADLDLEKSETLGLRLIKMLSHQINGSIELDRSAGTVFCLKFPVADKIH